MITIKDFENMTNTEKCDLINKHLETHNTKNFKDNEVAFTWTQAKKVLNVPAITHIDGKYMPTDSVAEYTQKKEKQVQTQSDLSSKDIEKIKTLLENAAFDKFLQLLTDKDTFDNLVSLASKYDFVGKYVLSINSKIDIKRATGNMKSTSMRIPEKTIEAWQQFTKESEYRTTDLFNTALIEFMQRYGHGTDL